MYVKSEKIYCHLGYGYFVTVKRCYSNKNVAQMILYSDSTHNWVSLEVINEISVFVLKNIYVDVFFPLSPPRLFTGLCCIYEYHGGYIIRRRNYLPMASTWVHPRFFWRGPCCSSLYIFVLSYFVSLHYDVLYDKNYVRFVFTSSCL
jgi:hypothetical protein